MSRHIILWQDKEPRLYCIQIRDNLYEVINGGYTIKLVHIDCGAYDAYVVDSTGEDRRGYDKCAYSGLTEAEPGMHYNDALEFARKYPPSNSLDSVAKGVRGVVGSSGVHNTQLAAYDLGKEYVQIENTAEYRTNDCCSCHLGHAPCGYCETRCGECLEGTVDEYGVCDNCNDTKLLFIIDTLETCTTMLCKYVPSDVLITNKIVSARIRKAIQILKDARS